MRLKLGDKVEHPDFGPGKVVQVLGEIASVKFFGETIDVQIKDLGIFNSLAPVLPNYSEKEYDKISFRRAFEAVNLGIVPPDSHELIAYSIDGKENQDLITSWLEEAPIHGLCKVVFGDYGTGKSHFLHIVRAVALRSGWVTAFTEFDPKAADPAKPVLVYRSLMANLNFPKKDDGSKNEGFLSLIKEIRSNWDNIQDLPLVKSSPWFRNALSTIMHYPHNDDPDYIRFCYWLAGQKAHMGDVRRMVTNAGRKAQLLPLMPQIKETSEIYCHHLVVINAVCRALGYKGLAIILDEAEHVRGFTALRRTRANNFFDILSRCAHLPLSTLPEPELNDFGHDLSKYWISGPHFSLFVGLTPGDEPFASVDSLRDECIFLHRETDKHLLFPPTTDKYCLWVYNFLKRFHKYYPVKTSVFQNNDGVEQVAKLLTQHFESVPLNKQVYRLWIKLASLVPAMLISKNTDSLNDLLNTIDRVCNEVIGNVLPWEQ